MTSRCVYAKKDLSLKHYLCLEMSWSTTYSNSFCIIDIISLLLSQCYLNHFPRQLYEYLRFLSFLVEFCEIFRLTLTHMYEKVQYSQIMPRFVFFCLKSIYQTLQGYFNDTVAIMSAQSAMSVLDKSSHEPTRDDDIAMHNRTALTFIGYTVMT